MTSWFTYLKRGLSRSAPGDRVAGSGSAVHSTASLSILHLYLVRHWRQGVLGVILVLVTSLLAFPHPLISRFLIDNVILSRRLDLLASVAVLLFGVKLLSKVTTTLQQFHFARLEQTVILDIHRDLFDRALRFPKFFFDDQELGYLMSRLSLDVRGLRWFFSGVLVHTAGNVLRFLGGLGVLFYLEWRLALVSMVAIPGLLFGASFFSRKIRVLSHHTMEQQATVSKQVQESLSATSLIKAFSSEKQTVGRLVSELQSAQQISLEQMTVSSAAGQVINFLPEIVRAVVMVTGAYWVIQEKWTLGSLLAFQSYLGYIYGPAQFLASISLQLQNALAALDRVSALFDIVPEENIGIGVRAARLCGEIEFRKVSFSYDGREPVLEDVSVHIQPGEYVAIVGPSGVGKTTLVSLILSFYKPTQGEICFDGRPASDYELRSLRQRIGYVSQRALLLSGTIGENLRYGNPEADPSQVVRAAKMAGIHEFIDGLPEGYDSQVGERGVKLSEGQKQRLSIARALIKEPDILVLDEPTASLDSIVELSIFDALSSVVRGKTLFVVTHRLSPVRHADRILLLNENQLVATGTHQELMAGNAYYRSLAANQQILAPTGLNDAVQTSSDSSV
jgi:ABC-type multidrug transport system fused ATPase/permease subunit